MSRLDRGGNAEGRLGWIGHWSKADLVAIRRDGSGRRNVTDVANDGAAAVQRALTADGQRLLFILTRAGKQETVMAVVGVDSLNLGPIGGSDYRDGFHPRLRPAP